MCPSRKGGGCTYSAEVKHLPNMFGSEGVGGEPPKAEPHIGRDQAKRTRDRSGTSVRLFASTSPANARREGAKYDHCLQQADPGTETLTDLGVLASVKKNYFSSLPNMCFFVREALESQHSASVLKTTGVCC